MMYICHSKRNSLHRDIHFVDVDECDNPDNCQFGTCVNTRGGYVCQCPPNYELNPTGTGCIGKALDSLS